MMELGSTTAVSITVFFRVGAVDHEPRFFWDFPVETVP